MTPTSASSSLEGMPVVAAVNSPIAQQQAQQNVNNPAGSIYLSESAHNTATNTTSSDGFSIASHTLDIITKMIVSLEDRQVKKGWRLYFVYVLMYAHLIWTQMMVQPFVTINEDNMVPMFFKH
ncbi:hypothetical protein FDP41_002516 [Naegleria fowleri]|uniref:Uncharacterized protein n=1 Tax=Naegleria fowleri TaxID=5763 RepID=A0A6A5BTY9_NAEFO|nr:uncharacterized protein FDP41_002516 [Naegleria fowleri]KAF0978696.1 hypothetical protein FDP41_002516 [Naegleria fowleri]